MPSYRSATVAAALDVAPKWLDNLLSHNKMTGVSSEGQGTARRLTTQAILHIALTHELGSSLHLSTNEALDLAGRLLADSGGFARLTSHLHISIDKQALAEEVASQLAHAVEVSPVPRRGRPPKT